MMKETWVLNNVKGLDGPENHLKGARAQSDGPSQQSGRSQLEQNHPPCAWPKSCPTCSRDYSASPKVNAKLCINLTCNFR